VCEPNCNSDGYAHCDCYGATESYTNSDRYGATESYADGHSYGTTKSYTDRHGYGDSYDHAECYGNGYSDTHGQADAHCQARRNTKATSEPSAATDVMGDQKSETIWGAASQVSVGNQLCNDGTI
jgi:hypothetical protein